VQIPLWRPGAEPQAKLDRIWLYGGVGRKI